MEDSNDDDEEEEEGAEQPDRDTTPKNVATLTAQAIDFDFSTNTPLKTWFHTAKVLLRHAETCEREGDVELAYLYYYRHVVLIIQKLRQYPATERAKYQDEMLQATRQAHGNLSKLERWKPEINDAYRRYVEAATEDEATVPRQHQSDVDSADDEERESIDPHEEPQLGTTMQQARQLLDRKSTHSLNDEPADRPLPTYIYPKVLHRQEKECLSQSSTPESFMSPLVPSKVAEDGRRVKQEPIVTPNKYKSYTEGGEGLRAVVLPTMFQQAFLKLAHPNTARNLETCGVLCASLRSNVLVITHLVLPDQTSTSDTCDTTDAGNTVLFDYCEPRSLIVVGWIHTHPTQSCFLSSRDLHTSSGYQQMLPEAIAIVCAPQQTPSLGIFRLTSPPGLPAVLRCHKPGLFHTHEETNLYTDATTPGHVMENPRLDLKVIDLRPR